MIKVSVIGSGSWGTANAISLASKGLNVKLWVRNKELLETINEKRENTTYLPDVMLPDKIHISNDLEHCCRESDIIVLGTPSHAVRETVHNIRSYLNKEQVIVNLAKGIENDTLCRMSEVIEEYLPDNPNAKYLYVYKLARNCSEGDQYCYEVPYGVGGYGVELDQPISVCWRIYLEKSTKTGPSYSEIVYDRAIKFDPKS